MADFSLRDLWWLQPKGPDNPLPALQLGVSIAQNKAKMDLAERDLANDIARTSLMREEMLAKQKIQTMLVAGNAEMATAISEVTDWTDEEQVSKVWETGARNPMTVGGKAWLGAQHMHESARTARRLEEEARSRIAQRQERSEINALIEERRALLADSAIDLNDARIRDLDSDIAFAERRTAIQEGNLELRREELSQKGKRLSIRSQRMYDNELKALNDEEKAKLGTLSTTSEEADRLRKLYNLRRRGLVEKFYGTQAAEPKTPRAGLQTNEPPAVVPAPASKVRVISPDGTPGFIPASQLEEALKAGYKQP